VLVLTHVHLDHAAAGQLMQALPNARAGAASRGAPHMIDPSMLIAASKVVMQESTRLYGDLVPISASA